MKEHYGRFGIGKGTTHEMDNEVECGFLLIAQALECCSSEGRALCHDLNAYSIPFV